jgi:hypothetical protein
MGRIVPISGKEVPLRPLETRGVDILARVFANRATTPEGALDFIKRFGPLTRLGRDKDLGEPVSAVIQQAKAMKEMLSYPEPWKREAVTHIRPQQVTFSFVADPNSGAIRLRYSPEDLLVALWHQLGQHLTRGGTFKVCRLCSELFAAGPGGRREDAEFCCDEHLRKYHNSRRGKAKAVSASSRPTKSGPQRRKH